MWFAGVDWSDTHHDLVIIDEAGRQVGARRVAHRPEGFTERQAFLWSITGQTRKSELACLIETTHGRLISFLLELGYPVSPVNPKTVDRHRRAAGAKTEQIEASLLAKHGRSEFADLRRWEPDSPKVAELKALTRDQESLLQMQTRLANQLTACLKAYFPAALSLFCQVQQRSTLIFLQTSPTLSAAQAATVEEIPALLRQVNYPAPKKGAAKIFALLHQPQLVADEVTIRTKSRLRQALVRQLLPVLEEIAPSDEEIERLFLSHEDSAVWSLLPRAGQRLARRLLAEMGDDPSRSADAASLQALAGTSPVLSESGKYSKAHRRSACVKPLRNALHQFTRPRTKQEAWARDYDDRKRKAGKSHSVAVGALATIWARVLFAMRRDGTCSHPLTFGESQRLPAKRAA